MSSNSNNQKTSISITMDLEKLQQKYSNLLTKYKAAVSEYVLFLNQQSKQPCGTYKSTSKCINQSPFVSIKGQAFIGTGSAGQSTATTLQDCEASCAKLSNCSGATFISGKCDIRVGDSPIITSSENSYAIIPKSKQLLYNMENINQQLLAINKEINNKIQTNQPIFYKNDTEVKQKTKELLSNYENLTKERETILELLNQYETLDRTDEQNLIKINQNYYSYILLTVLAFAVFYILYRISITSETPTIQYGGDLGINAYYILFFIILITIMIPLKNLLY